VRSILRQIDKANIPTKRCFVTPKINYLSGVGLPLPRQNSLQRPLDQLASIFWRSYRVLLMTAKYPVSEDTCNTVVLMEIISRPTVSMS